MTGTSPVALGQVPVPAVPPDLLTLWSTGKPAQVLGTGGTCQGPPCVCHRTWGTQERSWDLANKDGDGFVCFQAGTTELPGCAALPQLLPALVSCLCPAVTSEGTSPAQVCFPAGIPACRELRTQFLQDHCPYRARTGSKGLSGHSHFLAGF